MKNLYIGIDLGATSGRVILSSVEHGKLSTEEIIRFPNHFTELFGNYYWDIYELFANIKKGLAIVGSRGVEVCSIGVDTWGVDFVCVGEDGQFLGLPRAYRDPYTNGIPHEYFQKVSQREVYDRTGIQIMNFNSLYQLYAANKDKVTALGVAKHILFMPDAISYLLTGKMVCEYTILSTSQFMNPRTKSIDSELLSLAGVSREMFPEIVMPGHVVGRLTDQLAEQTGLGMVNVVAVAGHDTGSAVAAVPASGDNFAYLSSGTWSLMGIETAEPIITNESFAMNFTNEGGVDGTTRFLKNIAGMWLLEQCRAVWATEGHDYDYPSIIAMATEAQPFLSLVDSDDPLFANPTNMVEAIKRYCIEHNEAVPQSDGEIIRCIFDSLALKYNYVLGKLKTVSPHPIDVLHVIGGGAQNDLMNQFTANSIQLPVVAGPSEATTIGNIMVQARTSEQVDSIGQMRQFIRESIKTKTFTPCDTELWAEAYGKFINITNLK